MTDRIPDDAVVLIPHTVRTFYSTLNGNEIVGALLNTENLGDFAILLTPDAARILGDALTDAAVDRLRAEHGGD